MILNCGGTAAIFTRWRRPTTRRMVCLASEINTERLRAKLDQLHSEAQYTRTKANNARLRLMRLSEVAEKLRRQAAMSVQTGKENDARELLFQKKKVMQALDKSKARITLLDGLSSKLNEAISAKETQLIKNVASDVDIGGEDASSTVRIVSPKDEDSRNLSEDEDLDWNYMEFSADQILQVDAEGQTDKRIGSSADSLTASLISDIQSEDDMINSLKGIASYDDFIKRVDEQLNKIEAELVILLRVSTLVLDDNEKPKNPKVEQTVELLEGVRHLRERISSVMQKKVGTK